jgi:hypothetical protein
MPLAPRVPGGTIAVAAGAMIVSAAVLLFAAGAHAVLPGVSLVPDQADGHSPAWERRYYYGKLSWGIRGSRAVERGEMWFDRFPGKSGRYRIRLGVILENDGQALFQVQAAERTLADLRLPWASGKKDCERRGRPDVLDLGEYELNQGDRITVIGESDYACGLDKGGAYALWYRLSFEPVGPGAE